MFLFAGDLRRHPSLYELDAGNADPATPSFLSFFLRTKRHREHSTCPQEPGPAALPHEVAFFNAHRPPQKK